MGGEEAAKILSFAREHGVVTSADLLAPGEQAAQIAEWIGPALAHLDYLLPERGAGTGADRATDLRAGCEQLLGTAWAASRRPAAPTGRVVVDSDGSERVPAFATDVVDTTGCGDAFSAGFLRGLSLGRGPRDAAVLGCATAALVAQGLGSDHGDFDLAAAEAFAAATPTIQEVRS